MYINKWKFFVSSARLEKKWALSQHVTLVNKAGGIALRKRGEELEKGYSRVTFGTTFAAG